MDLGDFYGHQPEKLEQHLSELLIGVAQQFDFDLPAGSALFQFRSLIQALAKTEKVVILIDEYDKPILENLNQPELKKILEVLRGFYSIVKSCNEYIRLVFITGVSKFSHISIFSGLNNLKDISLEPNFATMLGYTQKEFEENFKEYIEEAARIHNLPREDILKEIKKWYDGYRFEEKSEQVYNPISVAKFFENNCRFKNYWFSTAIPAFLVKLARERDLNIEKEIAQTFSAEIFNTFEADRINPIGLLVQTGYLTIKSSELKFGRTVYHLGFPNYEVGDSFNTHLLNAYTEYSGEDGGIFVQKLAEGLYAGDIQQVYQVLDVFFAGISYEAHHKREDNFQNIFLTIFRILGYYVQTEVHTSNGRIDAVITTERDIFILEFKLNQGATALSQIQKNDYWKQFQLSGKKITLAGINFDTTTGRPCGMETEVLGQA